MNTPQIGYKRSTVVTVTPEIQRLFEEKLEEIPEGSAAGQVGWMFLKYYAFDKYVFQVDYSPGGGWWHMEAYELGFECVGPDDNFFEPRVRKTFEFPDAPLAIHRVHRLEFDMTDDQKSEWIVRNLHRDFNEIEVDYLRKLWGDLSGKASRL